MTTSTRPGSIETLLARFDARQPAALARALSIVENRRTGADELLSALHPRLGRARRIGVTGPPGAGKSTLTTAMARALRARGETVGVLAVDPTSPFTGGALLGDRIRMESVALDPGVFIRSMATRGSLGGLAAAAREAADVFDAFGFDHVLIETVGVGQSELDIARAADSSIVVLVPESGDSIQTLKAGLMEIADLFVVNKADRPGADRVRMDIEMMLGLRMGAATQAPAHHGVDLRALTEHERERARRANNPARAARAAAHEDDRAAWTPPVLPTVAQKGEGVDAVLAAVDRHFHYLAASGTLRERRRARLRDRVIEVTEMIARDRLWTDPATRDLLDARLDAMERGERSPFAVARELLAQAGATLTRTDG